MKQLWGKRIAVAAIVLALLGFGIGPVSRYYRFLATHVSTDDAYVDGAVVLISSRVTGNVNEIFVHDNWIVKQGDLLFTLDPTDFELRVERLRANMARARALVDQEFAQLTESEAGQRLAQSQLDQAARDFARAKSLRTVGVVSQEYYDQAQTSQSSAQANVALAQEEVARARATLDGDIVDRPRYDRAVVRQAEAELKAAELDLAYTKIHAPIGGVITRKIVHIGHRVAPGEPLMTIVPLDQLYVTANFKETQLTDVRVGQRAEVTADVYPGYVFVGKVESISLGTGSAFSLLPPENATGNWVKVVQRVPVKIVLDQRPPPDKQLRLGLSVEVSVDVSNPHGPLISSMLRGSPLGDHQLQAQ